MDQLPRFKPPGSLLAKAVVLVQFLLNVFWSRCFTSRRISYSFLVYLYVSGSGSITSVGEES